MVLLCIHTPTHTITYQSGIQPVPDFYYIETRPTPCSIEAGARFDDDDVEPTTVDLPDTEPCDMAAQEEADDLRGEMAAISDLVDQLSVLPLCRLQAN